jgi:hypothetical protein
MMPLEIPASSVNSMLLGAPFEPQQGHFVFSFQLLQPAAALRPPPTAHRPPFRRPRLALRGGVRVPLLECRKYEKAAYDAMPQLPAPATTPMMIP